MPAMLPAAVGASALGTGAAIGAGIGGAGLALGGGIAAGTALAGGTGLAGLLGGLGGAGAGAAGSMLGGAAITPTVASLAPAATAQAMGPSMLQSAGLDALKTQAIGGGVLPGAGQGLASTLPGVVNPATIQAQGAANLARLQSAGMPVAKPFGAETMLADTSTKIAPNVIQQTPSGFSEAGFRGIQPSGLNYPSLSNPTVSPLSTAQAVNPTDIVGRSIRPDQNFMQNLGNIGSFQDVKDYAEQHPYATSAMAGLGAMGISKMLEPKKIPKPEDESMIRPYTYERTQRPEAYATSPAMDSSERNYFNDQFIAGEPYKAAEGGIAAAYAVGGAVEQMAAMNAVGANTGYPMANLQTPMYANPAMQRPEATNVIAPSADAGVATYTGEARFAGGGEAQYGVSSNPNHVNPETQNRSQLAGGRRPTAPTAPLPKYTYDPKTMQFTQTVGGNSVTGGIATPAMSSMQTQPQPQRPATSINVPAYQSPEQQLGLGGFYDMMNQQLSGYGGFSGYAKGGNVGGESHLGDYSDGGRLLKGPGDGVSDSIPASIGGRQPARLADGEFVVPARIVSELGNGSTEAGARKLYAMMDRIQKGRRKSVGKGKVAVNSKADKHLPA